MTQNITFNAGQLFDGQDVSALATDLANQATAAEAHAYVEANALTMTQNITFNAGQLFDGQDVSALATDLANQATAAEAHAYVEANALTMTQNITFNAGQLFDGQDVSALATDLANQATAAEAHAYVEANALTMTQNITFNAGQLFDGQDVSALATDLANQATAAEAHAYVEANALTLTEDLTMSGNDIILGASTSLRVDGTPANSTYTGTVIDINTTGCATYDAVYIDGVNSVLPARANSMNTMPAIGIVVASGKVLILGTVRSDATFVLAADKVVYVSEDVAGDIKDAVPTSVGDIAQVIGYTIGTDMLYVNPAIVWVLRK